MREGDALWAARWRACQVLSQPLRPPPRAGQGSAHAGPGCLEEVPSGAPGGGSVVFSSLPDAALLMPCPPHAAIPLPGKGVPPVGCSPPHQMTSEDRESGTEVVRCGGFGQRPSPSFHPFLSKEGPARTPPYCPALAPPPHTPAQAHPPPPSPSAPPHPPAQAPPSPPCPGTPCCTPPISWTMRLALGMSRCVSCDNHSPLVLRTN